MGVIFSCIAGIFQCIGDCIMATVGLIASCIECIVASIANCLAGIVDCLTCGACRQVSLCFLPLPTLNVPPVLDGLRKSNEEGLRDEDEMIMILGVLSINHTPQCDGRTLYNLYHPRTQIALRSVIHNTVHT
ncbi:hypothetical protein B0H19DRAFT_228506 [Mycena capillaripes]|nr:hypothetical protein B0H19DRAFT_228506 [Mycena capillaripes]